MSQLTKEQFQAAIDHLRGHNYNGLLHSIGDGVSILLVDPHMSQPTKTNKAFTMLKDCGGGFASKVFDLNNLDPEFVAMFNLSQCHCVVVFDLSVWYSLGRGVREFMLAHEYGHVHLGHADMANTPDIVINDQWEIEADDFAFQYMNPSAMYAVMEYFGHTMHHLRLALGNREYAINRELLRTAVRQLDRRMRNLRMHLTPLAA